MIVFRLYWVNGAGPDVIQSISFDGTGRTVHSFNIPSDAAAYDIALLQVILVLTFCSGDLPAYVSQAWPLVQKKAKFLISGFQDYAVLSEREVSNNRSGIRVYERATGKPVISQGIMHPGHPNAYDVIAMDEHNQPMQRG